MSLLASQCRAARALLAWSQDDLVGASKVTKSTIANFEAGKRNPYERTLDDLRAAFEAAGVEFIGAGTASPEGGAGVRLKGGA
ncbi:helix-turn-helix domain-containing protein [Phreatobacter stygius]|uniref:Helix-turn-helix transcriptional regulator n=1 Tax=Phreatobacter stygius TaxID=1940610 RepID=A0A4D7BE59_9HYPH|nr:helix-turn-helix transcriptional regulator [Phreatobacter stygius]QCI68845.1 helix-turn-helix transcriptional regulator [Phreatobacter stygius]